MDDNVSGYNEPIEFNNESAPVFPDPNMINNLRISDTKFPNVNIAAGDYRPSSIQSSSEGDSPEDLDLSDAILKYINHILMEEDDVEHETRVFQESSAALEAAERSFYEALGEQYPPASRSLDQSIESPDDNCFGESLCPDWLIDPSSSGSDVSQSTSQSSYTSSSFDGSVDSSSATTHKIHDMSSDNEQFKKGVEEASEFRPSELKYDEFSDLSRGKKNPYRESMDLLDERRSSKQVAVYREPIVGPEMFDEVLLCGGEVNESALRKQLSESTKLSSKKKAGKRNVVDLTTLLTLCTQSVAVDDYKAANEFLKQIRMHATPTGDGMQRLAYYFADGLEARLAGKYKYGTQIYTPLNYMPSTAANVLKAYHTYLATCPFRKISNFFANKTIMNLSEKVTRLHIIDFGVLWGFQWPCFIQRLSSRPGGPPMLRITGIDLPCRGFRPAQRVEEAGRRLATYAETFKVPFEFNAIAQNWETIKLEDLKIDGDELLVVNSIFRLRSLLDETVTADGQSPRTIVLNLIRKTNPCVFVMGIMNGAFNGPFFTARFREALFHYSAIFDMLDANIPRGVNERMLIERLVFGKQAVNVIACEGGERVERAETYKQWQVRIMRAGFDQLPLDKEIMKMAREKVESSYHKDFVVDEDGEWMLQGWKGRIIYALSSWRPAY